MAYTLYVRDKRIEGRNVERKILGLGFFHREQLSTNCLFLLLGKVGMSMDPVQGLIDSHSHGGTTFPAE